MSLRMLSLQPRLKGRVLYWNEAAETILGFSSEEAVGHLLHETIVPR